MKIIAKNIFIAILFVPAVIGANDLLPHLESRIKSEGAKPVLKKIWNTLEFGKVLDGIASGNVRWLEVGLKFCNVSDAWVTSMLRESFALALIAAPSRILEFQKNGYLKFSIEELCESPFIDEPFIGYKEYFYRAEASVLSINNPNLSTEIKSCLNAMKKGKNIYLNVNNK